MYPQSDKVPCHPQAIGYDHLMLAPSEKDWKRRFIAVLCQRSITSGVGLYEALETASASADAQYQTHGIVTPEIEAEQFFLSHPPTLEAPRPGRD